MSSTRAVEEDTGGVPGMKASLGVSESGSDQEESGVEKMGLPVRSSRSFFDEEAVFANQLSFEPFFDVSGIDRPSSLAMTREGPHCVRSLGGTLPWCHLAYDFVAP